MQSKTFLLGVGCQKGGTTWLHDYLSSHPRVDMGFEKEYHVFDALHLAGSPITSIRSRQLKGLILQEKFNAKTHLGLVRLMAFCEDQSQYYDYFKGLLFDPSISLTGDITPAYAGLKSPVFKRINNNFRKRGIQVKVVFLMRDPIERIRSSYKMYCREKRESSGPPVDCAMYMRRRDVFARTAYELTIQELEKSFDESQLFYGFYEELFRGDAMLRDMVKFLGIPWRPANFDKVVNGGGGVPAQSDVDFSEVFERFAPTYQYIKNRFGVDRIGRIWQGC